MTVVVPARDAAGTLGATLDALGAQTAGPDVVVVDDGSSDGTAALAEAHPAVTRVVRLGGAGPGAARNAGAAAAAQDAEVLAFTDADCVPVPGWVAAGVRALEAGADLVQGRVDPDPAAPRSPFERTLSVTGAWGLFEAANLFVRRTAFRGFPEGVAAPGERFLGGRAPAKHLGEDVLFGWAAVRAGARVAFAPDALVHHAVFERSAAAYVAERRRLRHFPALVREAPELRRTFLRSGVFLTAGSAAFDGALAGALAAAARRSPLPLVLAAPYAVRVRRSARHWPSHPAWRLAAVQVTADAVGFAALLRGSLAARAPVL